MKSILIVAPQSKLDNMGDLLAAAHGFRVNVLSGYVNGREVLKEISEGDYQVIHFAGDSVKNALAMSDGTLEEERLRRAFTSSGTVEAVIFNTCGGIATAAMLYREGAVPRAIAWRVEVGDAIAIEWATLFYEALAAGAEYGAASDETAKTMEARHPGFEAPIYLNGRLVLIESQVAQLRREMIQLTNSTIFSKRLLTIVLAVSFLAALITNFFWFSLK